MSNKFARKACAAYKDGILVGKYKSCKEATISLDISMHSIQRCLSGKCVSVQGYVFKQIDYSEVCIERLDKSHIWKPTHIFPNHYLVSDDGQVYSVYTNKLINSAPDKDGYSYYTLCVAGDRHTIKTHRLVAEAFIPNPDNKPAIDHINGNRLDNRVENLRWVTNKENTHNPNTMSNLIKSCTSKERQEKLYAAGVRRNFGRKATVVYNDGKFFGEYPSQQAASDATGVSISKISCCVNGLRKQSKGFTFKRVEETGEVGDVEKYL